MGVGLCVCRIGYHEAVADKGVCDEVIGENRGICSRETKIQTIYRHRVDGGVQ